MAASVDFSDLFKQSNGLCRWSPDGAHLAVAAAHRLVVREADTLQIKHIFTCIDAIEAVEWCSDSTLVLCGVYKRAIAQVWSIEDPEWSCRISEGAAGMSHACWAPDGRHVITAADFQLHLTIWSLANRSVFFVKNPKAPVPAILAFSPDGQYLAVATRQDCKDAISIHLCATWELLRQIRPDTLDLAQLQWSPDSSALVVRDTSLVYRVLVFAVDGTQLTKYEAYEGALGVKSSAWSPAGRLLAVGSYDEMVRVMSTVTWRPVAEFEHSATVAESGVVVFREVPAGDEDAPGTRFSVEPVPATVPEVKPDPTKPNPQMGVGQVAWSADSRFLATRNSNMPTTVWLWDMARLKLSAVIVQATAVKRMAWDPCKLRLAICTSGAQLFFWTPDGASWVRVPADDFTVQNVQWHPAGGSLAVVGRSHYCCCFLESPPGDAAVRSAGDDDDDDMGLEAGAMAESSASPRRDEDNT